MEESSGAAGGAGGVGVVESDAKKQKTMEGETASTKAAASGGAGAMSEEGAPGEYALMTGGEPKKLEEQHKQQTSEIKTNEMVEQ